MPLILPPALRKGDIVRVVAPAGPFDPEKMEAGLEILRQRGLELVLRQDVFSRHWYMAGDDDRRLSELQEALDDPDTRAVWAIRGGYGTMRLLARLDLSRLTISPKLLIGFSDFTAVHAVSSLAGLASVHGPMVAGLSSATPEALERLWKLLFSPSTPEPVDFEPTVIRGGSCRGKLLGGNLSLLTRLLGTPFQPNLDGAILLIEDVGEAPYRLDRMLTHLELAGSNRRLTGVVVGEMTGCEVKNADHGSIDVLEEKLSRWNVPVVAGLPIGHGKMNLPIPLGLEAELDCCSGRLSFKGPLVTPR